MKFLAILQIVCILLLSSYMGKAKAMTQPVKLDCCKKQTKTCKRTTQPKDDCTAGNCSMLLTCGICGFLMVEPVNVKPDLVTNIASPVTIYKMGNVPGYSSSDWKPPKV